MHTLKVSAPLSIDVSSYCPGPGRGQTPAVNHFQKPGATCLTLPGALSSAPRVVEANMLHILHLDELCNLLSLHVAWGHMFLNSAKLVIMWP